MVIFYSLLAYCFQSAIEVFNHVFITITLFHKYSKSNYHILKLCDLQMYVHIWDITAPLLQEEYYLFQYYAIRSKLAHILKCQKFYLCKNKNLRGGIFFNTPPHFMVPINWRMNEPFFATCTTHNKRVIASKWPIQTHPIQNLTAFKHLPMHMCLHLVTMWLNPLASAIPLIHNWPLQVILT